MFIAAEATRVYEGLSRVFLPHKCKKCKNLKQFSQIYITSAQIQMFVAAEATRVYEGLSIIFLPHKCKKTSVATIPKGLAEKRLYAQVSDPGKDSDDFK